MSTSSKANNAANFKQGAYNPSAPRGDPMTSKGLQLGRKVNEADQHSEYHAQPYPSGAAPASKSYVPNPVSSIPGQANNPNVSAGQENEVATYTPGENTLLGATSGDVNRGFGTPMQGQTHNEARHNGAHGRKKQTAGLEGVGSSMQERGSGGQFAGQRALERE
ncbi:hypothetical protein PITC_002400 [Penicillium italicum]|uniref:Uncharacterized protein n=1 Tax=Penicillium italicum TaxID=40296 RepID=A0A0A2LD88_PENIT|nr:hypothetical protein PITC_002400 [Penicillium italicum]